MSFKSRALFGIIKKQLTTVSPDFVYNSSVYSIVTVFDNVVKVQRHVFELFGLVGVTNSDLFVLQKQAYDIEVAKSKAVMGLVPEGGKCGGSGIFHWGYM